MYKLCSPTSLENVEYGFDQIEKRFINHVLDEFIEMEPDDLVYKVENAVYLYRKQTRRTFDFYTEDQMLLQEVDHFLNFYKRKNKKNKNKKRA